MAALRVFDDCQLDRRLAWPDRIHFIFSCVGNSMGYGILWRFPSLACLHGGGGFLYPYVILLFTLGLPICYFEMAIGQFCNRGPVPAFACLAPICTGIGISMALISIVVTFYYNTFAAFNFFYIHKSIFSWQLPWLECNSQWGADEYCVVISQTTNESLPLCSDLRRNLNNTGKEVNDSQLREFVNCTRKSLETSTEQYFYKAVLGLPDDYATGGTSNTFNWLLAFYLLVAWLLTFLSIFVGFQSTKKVIQLTFIVPLVMMLCLLFASLDRDGAVDGLVYFLAPQWNYFVDLKVWISSACQVFYTLNVAYGGIIMYSSFKNINDNIFKDAITVTCINLITSLISGCVVFSTIGYLSRKLNSSIKSVTRIGTGPGLIYVVYPEAITGFPLPHLWYLLFFPMFILLGLDTPFTLIETFITSLFEFFHRFIKYRVHASIFVCVTCYLINLTCITQVCPWMINALDRAGNGWSILFIALCEICGISFFYGIRRFCKDISFMTSTTPIKVFSFYWAFFLPLLLTVFLIYYIFDSPPLLFYASPEPQWVYVVIWILMCIIITQIPAWAIAAIIFRKLTQKPVKTAFTKTSKWAPAEPAEHDAYHYFTCTSREIVTLVLPSTSAGSDSETFTLPQYKHRLTPFPSLDTAFFRKASSSRQEGQSKAVGTSRHDNPGAKARHSATAILSSGATSSSSPVRTDSLTSSDYDSPFTELSPNKPLSRTSSYVDIPSSADISPETKPEEEKEEDKVPPTEKTDTT